MTGELKNTSDNIAAYFKPSPAGLIVKQAGKEWIYTRVGAEEAIGVDQDGNGIIVQLNTKPMQLSGAARPISDMLTKCATPVSSIPK